MKKKDNQLIYIIGINCEVGKILNKKFREAGYRVDGCSSKINSGYDFFKFSSFISLQINFKISTCMLLIIGSPPPNFTYFNCDKFCWASISMNFFVVSLSLSSR